MITINNIINKYQENNPAQQSDLIRKAFEFAKSKHTGQKRLSGEDYISHPLSVAFSLADMGLDCESISAALLHDVVEDTATSLKEIRVEFGDKIAELVDGVTKLGEVDFSRLPQSKDGKTSQEVENYRKLFLAMSKDVRVIIIKLSDRLHNMRTLEFLPEKHQMRIAKETLDVFAPLADRFGMGAVKAELEDLSFKFLMPTEYKNVSKALEATKKEREHYVSKIKKYVLDELRNQGIEAKIDGRVKHLYSIYNKLAKVEGDFTKIYDLLAIRIIVDSVEDCYKTLGILHKHFKPLIYRIKDYIAVPKPNGYQSLHTTVFGLDGKITEFQVRTMEMHEEAENGVAAHWFYAESKKELAYQGKASMAPAKHLKWASKISSWQEGLENPDEFKEGLKLDLFSDRIFVFTPKGDIFDLPEGATPVDFAYEIHTAIGHRCRGARVNGKIIQLDNRLENRDVVEIILAPKNDKTGPSRGWLEFVRTSKAKQNIRSFFKKLNWDDNVEEGHKILTTELQYFGMTEGDLDAEQIKDLVAETAWKSWEDILASIGDGSVTPRQIIKKIIGQKFYIKLDELHSENRTGAKEVKENGSYGNLSGILVRYASCCNPISGDEIKGFITQGKGITIHRADCKNLLGSPQEKIINIDFEIPKNSKVKLKIEGQNRIGFIRDVTSIVSDEKINILDIRNEANSEQSDIFLTLALTDVSKLPDLMHRLSKIKGVVSVKKQ